jgi:hypothetical protein
MQNADALTREQIQEFLKGSEAIEFSGQNRSELYGWGQQVLVTQEYAGQSKKERGGIRAYIGKMTGLSLPPVTRLIHQYRAKGVVQAAPYRRQRFPVKYSQQDLALLAGVDRAHGWLSGPATLRIIQREAQPFGKAEYARLGQISVAHLYNLRNRAGDRTLAAKWEPTRPSAVAIGERRKPDPPRTARLSTHRHRSSRRWERHQRGVSHPCGGYGDAVAGGGLCGQDQRAPSAAGDDGDAAPVSLSDLGFHSDNGSEFINHGMDKLHQNLLIEFTKSRAHRSADNALVEGKNGAILRKHMGYGHIPAEHAESVQKFYTAYLNP